MSLRGQSHLSLLEGCTGTPTPSAMDGHLWPSSLANGLRKGLPGPLANQTWVGGCHSLPPASHLRLPARPCPRSSGRLALEPTLPSACPQCLPGRLTQGHLSGGPPGAPMSVNSRPQHLTALVPVSAHSTCTGLLLGQVGPLPSTAVDAQPGLTRPAREPSGLPTPRARPPPVADQNRLGLRDPRCKCGRRAAPGALTALGFGYRSHHLWRPSPVPTWPLLPPQSRRTPPPGLSRQTPGFIYA